MQNMNAKHECKSNCKEKGPMLVEIAIMPAEACFLEALQDTSAEMDISLVVQSNVTLMVVISEFAATCERVKSITIKQSNMLIYDTSFQMQISKLLS